MSPFQKLLQSRKFLLLASSAVIATALLLIAQFAPQWAPFAEKLVAVLTPLVITVIVGITVEDAAAKFRGVSNNPASNWQYDTRARGRATGEIPALKPEA